MKKKTYFHEIDLCLILAFTVYVLLDTFVIEHRYAVAVNSSEAQETEVTEDTKDTEDASGKHRHSDTSSSLLASTASEAVVTDTSYTDDNISITISTYTVNGTQVYVADVVLSDISSLSTAFADSTYGRNVTAQTSEIADSVNAILAINGDYYGARNSGYVVRNGVVYRTSSSGSDQEDLVILADGSFEIITEGSVSEDYLNSDDVLQVFSFGPSLLVNGEITVTADDEVDRAMTENPRTAICEIEPLHYLFVVADGRTDESEGLTLYELARFLQDLGVKTAYNLDGGGSSTMVFNGQLINNPTTTGNKIKERSVSDIVYIG